MKDLSRSICLAFPEKGAGFTLAQREILLGHDHPEQCELYLDLRGKTWRTVESTVLTRYDTSIFLAPNVVFDYFLPAVLIQIVENDDVSTYSQLVWELFPPVKKVDQPKQLDTFFERARFTSVQKNVFLQILLSPNLLAELHDREKARIMKLTKGCDL